MDMNQQYIELLISIRLRKLQQEGFDQIRFDDLERIFSKLVFKRQKPQFLHELTDRILNISTDEIIRYLTLDATMNTSKEGLDKILQGVLR